MKSVYTKILLSCFGIFILAVISFLLIARVNMYASFQNGGFLKGLVDSQFREALNTYQTRGAPSLSIYLQTLVDAYPGTRRYLLDQKDRDVVAGNNRSDLKKAAKSNWNRWRITGQFIVSRSSADGRYLFLFVPSSGSVISPLLPLYLPVLGMIALLLWAVAYHFSSPLKELSATVRRFGGGDLNARVVSKRADEIGDVACAFDEMASRIQTLLTAERRLLQDISHELRSPLARMSFAVELARTSSDREMAAARMKLEINRLTTLVESLLEITQAEGDPSSRNLEPIMLGSILDEIVEDCSLEANARECRVLLRRDTDVLIRADRELLRRAIENIVRNAIRHSPEATPIELAVDGSAARALVCVRDFGPGVPEQALESIFNPFYRVDEARVSNSHGGVGLGLAIAQRAILIHHGHVWAENAHPGLRVCINLPLENPASVGAILTNRSA